MPPKKSTASKTKASKARAPKRVTKTSAAQPDVSLVKALAKILNDADLSEIEMKTGNVEVRLSKYGAKHGGQFVQAAPTLAPMVAAAPVAASAPSPVAIAPAGKTDASAHPGAVKSPMVGTAYIRSSPDSEPFVKVGDKVKEGDTVLLVEAMKTFNPITAPKSGKIEEVLVQDAQPIEFGETLFIIV